MQIVHVKPGTKHKIATRGWKSVISEGMHPPFNIHDEVTRCDSLIAEQQGKHIGIVQFSTSDIRDRLYVGICYVDEEYRGDQVFSRLFQELKVYAKERGYRTLDISTHVDNTKMQSILEGNFKAKREFISYDISVY